MKLSKVKLSVQHSKHNKNKYRDAEISESIYSRLTDDLQKKIDISVG